VEVEANIISITPSYFEHIFCSTTIAEGYPPVIYHHAYYEGLLF